MNKTQNQSSLPSMILKTILLVLFSIVLFFISEVLFGLSYGLFFEFNPKDIEDYIYYDIGAGKDIDEIKSSIDRYFNKVLNSEAFIYWLFFSWIPWFILPFLYKNLYENLIYNSFFLFSFSVFMIFINFKYYLSVFIIFLVSYTIGVYMKKRLMYLKSV